MPNEGTEKTPQWIKTAREGGERGERLTLWLLVGGHALPIFASSYQLGSGRVSRLAHVGAYCENTARELKTPRKTNNNIDFFYRRPRAVGDRPRAVRRLDSRGLYAAYAAALWVHLRRCALNTMADGVHRSLITRIDTSKRFSEVV